MLSPDGDDRPTLEQIRNHPWMRKPFSMRLTREDLVAKWRRKLRKEKKVRELKKRQFDSGDV